MNRFFFKLLLFLLALSLPISPFSSENLLARSESGELALNTNAAMIEPVKQVANAYASLPETVANSYGGLSANVLDSFSSFFNKLLNIFKKPISSEIPPNQPIFISAPAVNPSADPSKTYITDITNVTKPLVPTQPSSVSHPLYQTKVVTGISESVLDQRLQALNDKLETEIYSLNNLPLLPSVINQYVTYRTGGGAKYPTTFNRIDQRLDALENATSTVGNPFDQDLNTTDSPTFASLTLANDLDVGGNINVTGNATANAFFGDGSNLTGIPSFSTSTTRSVFSASPPLSYNSGTGNFSIFQSSSTTDGYLSSADWITFNAKQGAGNYITALTGDATASGPGSATLTLATVNGNVGSFGSSTAIPTFTVNGKGLITAASTNPIVAPAGTLTGTTLAPNVVTSSLTSVGTIGTGVWQGTAVGPTFGGTGQTSYATGDMLYASALNTLSKRTVGSTGDVLSVSGGVPTWVATSSLGFASATTTAALTSSLASNYVPKWSGSAFLNSLVYDTGTNVGIGTTTPGSALTVVGQGYFSTTAKFGASTGTIGDTGGIFSNGLNIAGLSMRSTDIYTADSFTFKTDGQFKIQTGGSNDRLTILSTGNVGIGLTGPAAKLDVNGQVNVGGGTYNSSYGLTVRGPSDGNNAGIRVNNQSETEYMEIGPRGIHSTNDLTINTDADMSFVAGGSERVRISGGGPNGAIGFNAGSGVEAVIGVSPNDDGIFSGADAGDVAFVNFASGKAIRMSADFAAGAQFSLLSSGNVGIGTTNPGSLLTVAGDGTFSGNLSAVNLSGTNTGDQTITLTGDITGSGTGSFATTYNGTVPVNKGGTGQTSYTNGQLLIGNTTGNTLTKATLTGTTNQVNVTNGAGSITLSLPQSIDTAATVGFRKQTLTTTAASDIGLILRGVGADNAGTDNTNGIGFILGHNSSGNRQFWIGDSAQAGSAANYSFRFIPSFGIPNIDGISNDGNTRVAINLGTDNSNVGVGFTPGTDVVGDVAAKLHVVGTASNQFRVGYDKTTNYFNLNVSSAGLVAFDAAGSGANFTFNDNVGIGTASPQARLTIGQTLATTTTLLQLDNATNVAQNSNLDFTVLGGTIPIARMAAVYPSSNNIGLAFSTYNGSLGERLRIDKDGNVGIGTTAPSQKLEILGNTTGTVAAKIYNTNSSSTANARLMFGNDNIDTATYIALTSDAIGDIFQIVNNQGPIAFTTNSGVGIGTGTVSPSAKFHVLSTAEQARIGYDASNYYKTTVGSTGAVTFDAVGAGASFNFNDNVSLGVPLAISSGGTGVGSFTPGHVPFFDGSTQLLDTSIYSDSSGSNSLIGIGTENPEGQLHVVSVNNGVVGLIVQGDSHITGNIQEWRDFSNNLLSYIDPSGNYQFSSNRNLKENFTDLDKNELLAKINGLDIQSWNYKTQGESVTHIGPMAQDFYEAFHLGNSDKTISVIDPAGVALVGIQALSEQVDAQNASTTAALSSLELRISSIESLSDLINTDRTSIGSSIVSALQSFGAEVLGGVAYLKDVFVEHLTIGSPKTPTGITVYDQDGQEGCLIVLDVNEGTTKITPGKCEDMTVGQSDENDSTVVVNPEDDEESSSSEESNPTEATSSEPETAPVTEPELPTSSESESEEETIEADNPSGEESAPEGVENTE